MAGAEGRDCAAERVRGPVARHDERTRDVVTRLWMHAPRAKLRELAAQYGISMERVRQIEREAFTVLRAAIEHPPLAA